MLPFLFIKLFNKLQFEVRRNKVSKVNQKASVAEAKKVYVPGVKEDARRTLMTCLLWEDEYYENGVSIADRLRGYVKCLSEQDCRELLLEAKFQNKLRHAPLFWAVQMAKEGKLKADDVAKICDRVDTMADLLAIYFDENPLSDSEKSKCYKNGNRVHRDNKAVPKAITKGLQKAIENPRFDEYAFAKYRLEDKAIKTRDVIRLAHVKPSTPERSALYKKVLDGTLATPDTWEVAISAAGSDMDAKRDAWTRLLSENKLGVLALLRNLNGMNRAGVDQAKIRKAVKAASIGRVLPFQIVTASRHAPELADVLNTKFMESVENVEKLEGESLVLVDVSGSMSASLSTKSDTKRVDVAAALGALVKEVSKGSVIYAFDDSLRPVSTDLAGLPLVRELSRNGGCTAVAECTERAIKNYRSSHGGRDPARVIVVTDAQDNSSYNCGWGCEYDVARMPKVPYGTGYIVNVGAQKNGVEYALHSGWMTVYGWSDNIVKYIAALENERRK